MVPADTAGNGADVDVYARGKEEAPFVCEVKSRKEWWRVCAAGDLVGRFRLFVSKKESCHAPSRTAVAGVAQPAEAIVSRREMRESAGLEVAQCVTALLSARPAHSSRLPQQLRQLGDIGRNPALTVRAHCQHSCADGGPMHASYPPDVHKKTGQFAV